MIRHALLSAALLAFPVLARAQTPAAGVQSQLDRMEGKLDNVLRLLHQLHLQPSGAAQGTATASGSALPSPAPSAAPAAFEAAYKPGALAIAHAASREINGLSEIPPDSVGGFVYEGGPIAFTDIRSRGVRYFGPAAVEIQGWLQAKEAGRYELATDLTAHFHLGAMIAPTCFLQAWLEGRSLDQRSALVSHPGSQEANATLVLGAELQPGLYRLRVWTTCTAPPSVSTTSELLLKAPSELNLRPVTASDLLHKQG